QPNDQADALKTCFVDRWGYSRNGPEKQAVSVRDLSGWIQEHIHLDLHAAPFSKSDPELVPAAGPCTTCPKRTGFAPALFPDIAKKDTCTDPSCYQGKIEAHITAKTAQLKEKGEQVVAVSSEYSGGRKAKDNAVLPADRYAVLSGKKDRCDAAE